MYDYEESIQESVIGRLAEHETLLRLSATKEELLRLHTIIHTLREELKYLREEAKRKTDFEMERRAKDIVCRLLKNRDALPSQCA